MFEKLIVYHQLNEDPVINLFYQLTKNPEDTTLYYEIIRRLSKKGMSFKGHLYQEMIKTEHPALAALYQKEASDFHIHCLKHDLALLSKWIMNDVENIGKLNPDGYHLLKALLEDELVDLAYSYQLIMELITNEGISKGFELFLRTLKEYGNGLYALHEAFYLSDDNILEPIKDFDYLDWDCIYGYDKEKEKLERNTKAFVQGLSFHHVLLVGASGTGKSSSVKSIVNRYHDQHLRLIQMDKKQLNQLPYVLKKIEKSCFKFILFIDDLSFEVNEDDYKFVKSFIEGGVKNEAKNVAFYVTSNRRHLIKEIRSERENDIHLNDFISEMTSLSDRFGLTMFFTAPDQKLYYEMVEKMLLEQDLVYEKEEMLIEAKQWSLRHGGMSGRVAEQFVKNYKIAATLR